MLRITAESKELTLIGNQDHKLILIASDSNSSVSSLVPRPLINERPGTRLQCLKLSTSNQIVLKYAYQELMGTLLAS